MTFKPAIWHPIAFVLSVVNLVAVGFAAGDAQPYHAAGHAALALAFGLWVQRLSQKRRPASELQGTAEVLDALDGLQEDVSQLRRELGETQERVDFAERVLAQKSEARRMEP
jgi:flagellin-like hook-associated protein FlgL